MAEQFSDRVQLTHLAFQHIRRSAYGHVLKSPLYRWRHNARAADQLLIVPQDLRTADPSFMSEISHGHFGLAGAVALTDTRSPFMVLAPTPAWARELHGFSWLRHFDGQYDEIARKHAQKCVQDWIKFNKKFDALAWEPQIVGRRIISWLSHTNLLLDHVEQNDYDAVMRSLSQQIYFLKGTYHDTPSGVARLTALTALTFAGLCIADQDPLLHEAGKAFSDELKRQVLPDGGHISRNPWNAVELLLDLLPLKQCFRARNKDVPAPLADALAQMPKNLRMMRLGDGHLARFNGMSATLADALATVLAYDDTLIAPQGLAPKSAYFRMENHRTIIVMDVGAAPPPAVSSEAHAGCLSFEMSSGIHPIIVNCGAPGAGDQSRRLEARATIAHSTLSIGNKSSARLLQRRFIERLFSAPLLSGPDKIRLRADDKDGKKMIEASHNGFEADYEVLHKRHMTLAPTGLVLEGVDHILAKIQPAKSKKNAKAQQGYRFSIHFHIHPAVEVTYGPSQNSAHLRLPNQELWQFSCAQLPVSIEESVFLADYHAPQRCTQLVLRGRGKGPAAIAWMMRCVEVSQGQSEHSYGEITPGARSGMEANPALRGASYNDGDITTLLPPQSTPRNGASEE